MTIENLKKWAIWGEGQRVVANQLKLLKNLVVVAERIAISANHSRNSHIEI
jgi:hypothetical protein